MKTEIEQLQELMDDISSWSKTTFKQQNVVSKSYHLQKESIELTYSLEKYLLSKPEVKGKNALAIAEELADCMILLLDCSKICGFNAKTLLENCARKMEKNKKRKWGKPDKNGVVEHIRED